MLLLRVQIPDVPGSLGRLASAIGASGGDIVAIEIVEKAHGIAVDDVLLDTTDGVMPDSIVSACTALDGVRVLWVSRYAAGGNLFLDLEVVEDLTGDPEGALDRLVDLMPVTFRCEWAARVSRDGVVRATEGAPEGVAWSEVTATRRLPAVGDDLLCAAPLAGDSLVIGRRGGPEFLDSELARFHHLVALAVSISRTV
jgi:hypothetical protein